MSAADVKYRMLRLFDTDAHFRNSPGAVLLNKIDFSRPGYAEALNSKLYHQKTEMNFIASCECGYYEDNYYIGATCPVCKTLVVSPLSFNREHLPHTTWISAPEIIPGFPHPTFYRTLHAWLRYNRTDSYIDAILNPAKPLPAVLAGFVKGRGFKYFHDNFDYLVEQFFTITKRANSMHIRRLMEKYRHLAFVRYLPALSSVLHPITAADESAESSRRYTDKDSQFFLEAVHQLSYIEHNHKKIRRGDTLDIKLFEAYRSYMEYLSKITDRRLSKKASLLRRHMFGARFHWSFRAVIVPLTGPHRYDEIHVPWQVGVNTLRVHLLGRLMKRHKMPMSKAYALIKHAGAAYDPLIDQLMKEFIAESERGGGLPVPTNRNPSLRKGATQLIYITKIKTDLADAAMGFSPLIVSAPNADYDGDSLNGLLLLESDAAEKYLTMHPSTNYFSYNAPTVSKDIVLPDQPTILLAAWQGLV